MSDIAKITAYLTDVNHFGDFNEVYKKAFSAPYPARTCIMVKELPMNALVEVDATIYKKE
jgi:2-iminobutanoate/2-iminopropanoate deaminase